ncbi:amino acid kinase family protein [Pseudaminobacter sp. NGMCC 1.201702]|uniref:amino acid kinase family protein n=1 Tax=Pseudaminobacter sp. NGMCC 1.201702 TaxID=3391825 RepID=UPI0039F028AF
MRRVVVKLGGSTAFSPEMREWIDALAASTVPLVLVPGGGPFADAVRQAQSQMAYSDRAAHFMAILAMEQMALALLETSARLAPARAIGDMEVLLEQGRIPVWLPSQMCLAATAIPQSWEATSDSLAAWLAAEIDAETLLLIKQTNAFDPRASVEDLVRAGIVDTMLPQMLAADVSLHLAGPSALASARAKLVAGQLPGVEIVSRGNAVRGAA